MAFDQLNYLKTLKIIYQKKLIFLFSRSKNLDYQKFIILSSPRSGSTLLHTYLNSSPNINSLGEKPWRDIEQGRAENYFDSNAKMIQAVGLKLFYQFCEQTPYQRLYQELLAIPDLKIIHLTRSNQLNQFLSLQLALQKQQWTHKNQSSRSTTKIRLDFKEFQKHLDDHEKWRKQCLKGFSNYEMLNLSFEVLKNDPDQALRDVQYFLGLTGRRLFTVLKKQAPFALEEILTNIDDVKSRYGEYFSNQ